MTYRTYTTYMNIIAKHGGYENLKSFQMAQIAYDLNFQFCEKYVPSHKMRDQMEGAGRGGAQNIGEGSRTSGTSKQSELRLVNVARASLDELKLDYEAFLRQRNLPMWDKNDSRILVIRKLAYEPNRTYKTYMTYMTGPESAANCVLCVINQANYLLDQQLRSLEKDLMELFPKKQWNQITNLLINYGRNICPARKHDCKSHPLTALYPKANIIWPRAK